MPTEAKVTPFAIRRATLADQADIDRLLASNALPIDGVHDALDDFLVAEADAAIIGVVGMEYRGDFGLLRSTAVDPAWRSRGVARQLVERIIDEARSRHTRALYLLTTTAERYFPSFGFQLTTRDLVPPEVRATTEFQSACPASATVMSMSLEDAHARP